MKNTKLDQRFKRVCLVDSFSPKSHHEQYNASMAIMLCSIFEEVIYYVGDGQKQSLCEKLKGCRCEVDKIQWRKFNISEKIGKVALFKRHIKSLFYNLYVLVISSQTLLIFNYNNPFALFPIKLVNLLFNRKIIIINHGELEYMTNDTFIPYASSTRIVGKLMKTSFRFCRNKKNIFYLVIGNSIKRNLESFDVVNSSSVISLDHPYIFQSKNHKVQGKITIGVKNIHTYFDTDLYIQTLADENPDITFVIIGAPTTASAPNIKIHTKTFQMERSQYERILSSFDYFLFLYSSHEYKLKASGAIYDAIELGIGVIAEHNDYFDYIFAENGSLGCLCDKLEDIPYKLPFILSSINKQELEEHINMAKKRYDPMAIAINFREILKKII